MKEHTQKTALLIRAMVKGATTEEQVRANFKELGRKAEEMLGIMQDKTASYIAFDAAQKEFTKVADERTDVLEALLLRPLAEAVVTEAERQGWAAVPNGDWLAFCNIIRRSRSVKGAVAKVKKAIRVREAAAGPFPIAS